MLAAQREGGPSQPKLVSGEEAETIEGIVEVFSSLHNASQSPF